MSDDEPDPRRPARASVDVTVGTVGHTVAWIVLAVLLVGGVLGLFLTRS